MPERLTIGEAAGRAGLNVQTLRYYERRGLLRPDARRESGYRLYGAEAVTRLRFIKNAQALGFTLAEVSGLLRLRVGRSARCADVRRRAEAKLRDVERRLESLGSMRRVLKELVATCRRKGATEPCPILRSMEGGAR